MKKYNVVWIMVDSVRRYHTTGDDRSRLDVMDDFAHQGVEFLNCVTSAPSTIMSVSASMTSMPACHLGRNYDDFQFDNGYFATLPSILKEHGWETKRSFIMHREVREKLRQFELVPKKYWPSDFSHRKWWCNDDINRLIHNTLEKDKANQVMPAFWFVDYNCRKDDHISDIVDNTITSLQSAGFTEDNTIFVLCSDHGYPDPSRGITPEYLKKKRLSHDVFMTDDNIMIPLIFKYPGCEKGKKVHQTISTLDLLPTILDILEINPGEQISRKFHGKSLLPLLNGEETASYEDRKIRSDARFIYQPGRLTALRGDKYKYVLHHDDKEEEFNFVGENKFEEPSVLDSNDPEVKQAFEAFKEAYEKSEKEAFEAQQSYAAYLLYNRILKQLNGKAGKIDLLLVGDVPEHTVNELKYEFDHSKVMELGKYTLVPSVEKANTDPYTIALVFIKEGENQINTGKLNAMHIVVLDLLRLNKTKMKKLGKMAKLAEHFKLIWRNRDFYIREPLLIFYEPHELYKRAFNRPEDYVIKPFQKRTFKP